jgi:hypothetical protein
MSSCFLRRTLVKTQKLQKFTHGTSAEQLNCVFSVGAGQKLFAIVSRALQSRTGMKPESVVHAVHDCIVSWKKSLDLPSGRQRTTTRVTTAHA